MKKLVWRSLVHRWLQNSVLVLTSALGLAVILAIVLLYQGVTQGLELSKERMGADIVVVPASVTTEPSLYLFGGGTVNQYMPETTVDKLAAIPGVTRVTPQFFTHSLTADCHDIGNNNRMLGYDPKTDWILKPWLKKFNKEELTDDEIILGTKVTSWKQDEISILGKWYKIVAKAEETGTSLDYSLFVSMAEARRVAGSSHQLKSVWVEEGAPETLVSAVLLKIDEKANLEHILTEIQQIGFFRPIVAAEVKQHVIEQFTVILTLLGGVGVLTIGLAIFNLFVGFYTAIRERSAEWGLYHALGATSKQIYVLVLSETLAVLLAAALLGVAGGWALYSIGWLVVEHYQSFPFVAPPIQFIFGVGAGLSIVFLLIGLAASWLPAYLAAKIPPGYVMLRGEKD